ncbi:uroporphyrinogen-III C-methyltransferase [Sanguibacter suaedae]|uniref:uroporphyrinogen-III C-methyltransferase n=1 Tax=Sanguibacter suaedae TaxID=2795737 RepID=A0A934ICF8_9MICO|nr:uroporphyrinogen-III C-methyltransferase [Sanguibacter suaedae]MBI9115230.1 uroporphyrinogen-III C-methyltransferase [Sanguibacter suaedae]
MTTLLAVDTAGRKVLVVGGGPAAAHRAAALALEGAHVLVVAPRICEALVDLHIDGHVEWRRDVVTPDDLDDVWLVHTATGDLATDARVAAWAESRRVWCLTAGAPGVTPGAVGAAASARVPTADEVNVALAGSGALPPGRRVARPDPVTRRDHPGRVVLVGGGPGDVDLLTVRGRRALALADVVVTDRLGPVAVLDELGPGVEVVDVGKAPGRHPVPQNEINRILVDRARRGQTVVRLKGGDPFVLGRGGEEVVACREAGVSVEVVPGVSSAVAAPAAAGIPLTHRGTVAAVHIVNGHDELSDAACLAVRDRSATVVVLMGVATLAATVHRALVRGASPTTPVAIVERGCTPTQRVTRAELATVVAVARRREVTSPAVVVIGDVAAPGLLEVDLEQLLDGSTLPVTAERMA